ncbi:MAG: hypothetical protein J6T45_07915 [Fibrobacterales bacterium]|nr:hypothetical protein [Fibrobacterales bacterium]
MAGSKKGSTGKNVQSKTGKVKKQAPKTLMRFTTLARLIEMIEQRGIPLGNASRWDDQIDKAFVKKGCNRYNAEKCGIMCFMDCNYPIREEDSEVPEKEHVVRRETYAHWNAYNLKRDETLELSPNDIPIRIDFKRSVIDSAPLKGVNPSRDIIKRWLDPVKYKSFSECKKIARSGKKGLFFSKRYAYEWENEYRLVVLGRRDDAKPFLLEIPDIEGAIEQVVFSPFIRPCPLKCVTPSVECLRKLAMWLFENKWESAGKDKVRPVLESLLAPGKSHRSGILDNQTLLKACGEDTENVDCPLKKNLQCRSKVPRLPKTKPAKDVPAKRRTSTR